MERQITVSNGAGLRRLTLHGREAVSSYQQIVAIVRARLDEDHARLFARPAIGPATEIIWLTEREGPIRSTDELSASERSALEQRSKALLTDIEQLAHLLKSEGDAASLAGHMIDRALRIPGPNALWSIGGMPVIATWGHAAESEADLIDPIIQRRGAITAPAVASLHKEPSPLILAPPAQSQPRRWPWAALALLLIAVPLFIWRAPPGCVPGRDELEAALSMRVNEPADLSPGTSVQTEPGIVSIEPAVAPVDAVVDDPCVTTGMMQPETPLVVVFDTSGSMNMGMNIPIGDLREIEHDLKSSLPMVQAGAAMRLQLLQNRPVAPGQRRIDIARSVLSQSLAKVDPARLSVITFPNQCMIQSDNGRAAMEVILKQPASAATPLAAALERAAQIVSPGLSSPGGQGHVVVLSDGTDSCGGDVCAVGARIAQQMPGVVINIIEIAIDSGLECVSKATGGFYRSVNEAGDLANLVDNAVRQASLSACSVPKR
jgi:hypothetical protein